MNIYEKVNELRVRFLSQQHKKTGWNNFGKYSYFELPDFIPDVMQLCGALGITPVFKVKKGNAKLKVVNTEAPEESITFTAPFGGCQLKGCHEVQNIGASITYMRRYMWGVALEMVENDTIDAITNPNKEPETEKPETEKPETEKPYKKAPSLDVDAVKKAMQTAGTIEKLDKYMENVNKRGTPGQIEEISKFYEEYKKIITDFKNKLGTPE